MQITEELIYFIWRYTYYDVQALATTANEPIEVVSNGQRNLDSGPDFSNAKIKIADTLWAGNVEIHVKASDWILHQHQRDAAYQNVILHVVWIRDQDILYPSGSTIPCLELKDRVNPAMLRQYQYLMQNQHWIPCEELLPGIPELIKESWLYRLMADRLEEKSTNILIDLKAQHEDWPSVVYNKLARALGAPVNGDVMETLARACPLHRIGKHRDQLIQIEAMLFGQSGLLAEVHDEDEYIAKLKQEYHFLQKKFELTPMKGSAWKFMRMRPAHFPTIRIAQLARILYQSESLFSKILAAHDVKEIINLLDVKATQYWKNHYTFGDPGPSKDKKLGIQSIYIIIINTICPLLFAYGIYTDDENYKDKALRLLGDVPAEINTITTSWANLGWKAEHAMHSQAMIQLKNQYCNQKKCLNCSIGHQILKSTR